MLSSVTQIITDALLKVFRFPELVTVLISVLPIVEARGAIPMAISMGIRPPFALLYSFIGSSLMAPVLIAVLLPFVKWLSKTKCFRKVGETLYEKFEKKSQGIADTPASDADEAQKKKSERKKMWGVFAFVAIPLPLTGVWTGSAVAAVTRLPFIKALIAVLGGNLVANCVLTLLFAFLPKRIIDYIVLAIGIIAIAVVVFLIVKIVLHKSPAPETESEHKENE